LEAAVLLERKAQKREFGKLLTRVEALEAAAAKEKKARTDLETTTKEKLDSLETRDPPEQATLVATSVKAMILKDEEFLQRVRADANVQPTQNNNQSEQVITPATFVEAVSAACSSLTRPQYGMDFGGHGGVYVPSGTYQQLLQGQQQQQPARSTRNRGLLSPSQAFHPLYFDLNPQ
jgi:hypothetical protein